MFFTGIGWDMGWDGMNGMNEILLGHFLTCLLCSWLLVLADLIPFIFLILLFYFVWRFGVIDQ